MKKVLSAFEVSRNWSINMPCLMYLNNQDQDNCLLICLQILTRAFVQTCVWFRFGSQDLDVFDVN